MEKVIFYRRYKGFSGGHLKVWHYFNHTRSSPDFRAGIFFSKDTIWDQSNPWDEVRHEALGVWPPKSADILFLAGLDWLSLSEEIRKDPKIPVVNLIQGIRHADPADPRYQFLDHKAVRICVSEEIKEALADSRKVNGPLFVIPNGIEIGSVSAPVKKNLENVGLLIVGYKQPELGRLLLKELDNSGIQVDFLLEKVSRNEFLQRVGRAKATLFLPDLKEGFYLPALEGMAMGTVVICPDCVGNRSFCIPNFSCFRPEYSSESILRAVQAAMTLTEEESRRILLNAGSIVSMHTLENEKKAFLEILRNLRIIW